MTENKNKFPTSIAYIIGNEAAERFSYYGMRSILPTFLVAQFFNPTLNPALQTVAEAQANESTHLFISLAYAMPVLGAILADWFFGKYKVILYVSIIYCIGHLVLSVYDTNLDYFKVGLLLIAMGAGGIKSCTTANVGDQFTAHNQHLMTKAYSWFYFSINAGSVLSTMAIPYIYAQYGAKWAFGVPGILMTIATVIFFSGRKKYIKIPPFGIKKDNFISISLYALINISEKKKGESLLDIAKQKFNPEKVEAIKSVWRVMAVFAFIPIFWALWDQCLSEWVLQATKLDRHIFGINFLPEQIQTVNPFFLLSFIPIFSYFVYPFCEKIGINFTPLRKIGAGLILTALSFVIIALIQTAIDTGNQPSVWWQILAYAVLSTGEVLVYLTGLEYAYTQSPKSMKSTMNALFLLTVTIGNLFVSMVNNSIANNGFFAQLKGANYYWFFVALISAFIVIYLFVSPKIKESSYVND
ncbi:MAG: MFS transporter [Sphingobacteriales bacterium]|nr:MAG: MFS transporter [Sphingobacteriales bacterium]TAF82418.1 MAG: MFS transporter [Sphingobacteriales bacterium]